MNRSRKWKKERVKIWQRKDRGNKWYGRYWQAGKRHTKAFKSEADACQWQTYMLYKLTHEDWQTIRGTDWQTATRLFLETKQTDISQSSITELTNTLQQFENIIGPLRTDLIHQLHINDFKRKRLATPSGKSTKQKKAPAARTVNKDLANLRTFLNWCIESHIAHNGLNFKMLKEPKQKFIPPAKEQLWELFERASEEYPPLYLRMVLALTTGLRRGALELITLSDTGAHIDFERNFLTTYESKSKEWVVKDIGEHTMRILHAYIDWLPVGAQKLLPDSWDGKARYVWEKLRKRVGLPNLKFHNLRNLSVSILGAQGESKEVLQKALGHKSYKTTEKHYFDINSETSQRITKTLDDMFACAPCTF